MGFLWFPYGVSQIRQFRNTGFFLTEVISGFGGIWLGGLVGDWVRGSSDYVDELNLTSCNNNIRTSWYWLINNNKIG